MSAGELVVSALQVPLSCPLAQRCTVLLSYFATVLLYSVITASVGVQPWSGTGYRFSVQRCSTGPGECIPRTETRQSVAPQMRLSRSAPSRDAQSFFPILLLYYSSSDADPIWCSRMVANKLRSSSSKGARPGGGSSFVRTQSKSFCIT